MQHSKKNYTKFRFEILSYEAHIPKLERALDECTWKILAKLTWAARWFLGCVLFQKFGQLQMLMTPSVSCGILVC